MYRFDGNFHFLTCSQKVRSITANIGMGMVIVSEIGSEIRVSATSQVFTLDTRSHKNLRGRGESATHLRSKVMSKMTSF